MKHLWWIRSFAVDAPLCWAIYYEHWRIAPSKNNRVRVPGFGRQGTSLIITNLKLYFKTVQNSYYLEPYNIVLGSTRKLLSLLSRRPGWRAGCKGSVRQPKSFSTIGLPACSLSHHPWSPLIRCMCITSVLLSPLFSFLGITLYSHLHSFLAECPLHVCQTLTGGVCFPELLHYPPSIIQLNYLKNLSVKQQEITNSKWPM